MALRKFLKILVIGIFAGRLSLIPVLLDGLCPGVLGPQSLGFRGNLMRSQAKPHLYRAQPPATALGDWLAGVLTPLVGEGHRHRPSILLVCIGLVKFKYNSTQLIDHLNTLIWTKAVWLQSPVSSSAKLKELGFQGGWRRSKLEWRNDDFIAFQLQGPG